MLIPLIPVPNYVQAGEGSAFELTTTTRVVTDRGTRDAVELFVAQLRAATGFTLEIRESTSGATARGNIVFEVAPDADYRAGAADPEAYRIESHADGVRVTAASVHGVFNATQTLRQLLPAAVEAQGALADWEIPAVEIVDWPEFSYRGLMIDVARSFLTVEEMKQIIDLAGSIKISRLHVHLTDDQGWRIEITNDGRAEGDTIDYTRLTAVSGRTAMTECGYDGEPGRTGFYTQEDYKQIVEYAAARHITVIPEIDLPGHSIGALAAIEELNTPGSSHEGTSDEPRCPPDGSADVGHSYLDPHSEYTYTFARHVLRQVASITPGEYLHIGGDEPWKMTERHGHDVYIECVRRIVGIVEEVGKKPAGWNEIAEADPGPGMIVQFWQGESTRTVHAAKGGAKILLSRGESTYLDQKYHPEFPVGLDWACKGECDFPQYYSWEPTELIPELTRDQIAGVEAPLWSETLRGSSQTLLMVFPRLFATAELGWSAPCTRDLGSFTARIAAVAPRLLLAGGNFYDDERVRWRPAVAGYEVDAVPSATRVARVAAPGGETPGVSVQVAGRELPAELEVIRERGPLHAGPVIDVIIDGDAVAAGEEGRVHVGEVSAPVRVR